MMIFSNARYDFGGCIQVDIDGVQCTVPPDDNNIIYRQMIAAKTPIAAHVKPQAAGESLYAELEFARKHLPAIAQALLAAKVALPKETTDDLAAVLAAREA